MQICTHLCRTICSGKRTGIFTFMIPAVCRILAFMLNEQKKGTDDAMDLKFVGLWFSKAASKILRISDG